MRILGDIGSALARILESESGTVRVDELRDTEGVHLTYDIARLSESELYAQDTRGWDTGALSQSAEDGQTITDLPPIFDLLGVFVTTDNSARIAQASLLAMDVGVAGSTRDWPLWYWVTGDATQGRPNGSTIGDGTLNTMLLPPDSQRFFRFGHHLTYRDALKARQGPVRLEARTVATAFGAGTVQVTGHIVIGFFRRGRYLLSGRPF